jgi:MFS family permease
VIGVLAPSLGVLVDARVLLGFGTCAGYPAAMFLIRSEAQRTGLSSPAGVLTALSVSSQTIAVIGPSLGGLLIGLGGWRSVFAVNIPLAVACLILGFRTLPRNVPVARDERRVDVIGIVLFAAMLTTLLLFLMDPHVTGLWLLALTAATAAGFAVRELRVTEPFIDLRVFAGNAPLLTTYGRNLLAYIVSYGFLYGFTQWMEASRGLSASHAGLILLPMFLTAIIVSTITGRRLQIRGKLVAGSLCQIAACALLLIMRGDSAIWLLIVVAVIIGVPQGLISLANQNAVYWQADPARMGASAGLLRTFTYLGAIVASAANGLFFTRGATTTGLHDLAVFMLVAGVLFLGVTAADRSLKRVGARATTRAPGDAPTPPPAASPAPR